MALLPKKNTFYIDKWEVDPIRNTISDGTEQHEVEPKAMQILEYLACYAGETVHRDVLFKAFWPNQSVTEEALTRIISHLRQCFADMPRSPHYIVTIRNTGYCLIAKVTSGNYFANYLEGLSGSNNAFSRINSLNAPSNAFKTAGKLATFSIAVSLIYFIFNQPVISDASKVKVQYITSELGEEMSPAISSDGMNVVYTKGVGQYDADNISDYKIVLMLENIASNTIKRLAYPNGASSHPTWSPDNRYIAFANELEIEPSKMQYEIYKTDIQTGEFELLTKTSTHSHGLSWSPDGRYIVYPDGPAQSKIRYLYRLDTNTNLRIRIAPYDVDGGHIVYGYPKYSPDGTKIAVIRTDRGSYDTIDIINTKDYSSSSIYSSETKLSSLEWKDNQTLFIVDGSEASNQLLELSIRSKTTRRVDIDNKEIEYLSYSQTTGRLIFESINQPNNIYTTNFADGMHPLDFTPFTQSSKQELEAVASADDKYTAIISTRSGSFEIWLKDNVNKQTRKLTALNASSIKGLDWSPNNKRISFVATINSEAALFWVDVETKKIDSFSHARSRYSLIGWADNNTLLFSSNHNQNWKLFRLDAEAKNVEMALNDPVSHGRLSPDRKTLYYVKYNDAGVWQADIRLMEPISVAGAENIGLYESWTVSDYGLLYFMHGNTGKFDQLFFLDFKTSKIKRAAQILGVHLNRIYWNNNRLYYSLYESRESDIALIESL